MHVRGILLWRSLTGSRQLLKNERSTLKQRNGLFVDGKGTSPACRIDLGVVYADEIARPSAFPG
jgi:hypothetical protein